MTKDNKKCNECGESLNSPYTYKGRNNTFLCGGNWMRGIGKCGWNVCFICGKVETRTKWVKGEDCCGNEKMVETNVDMFSQFEKDENDPNRELKVCYCDEHKEEAKKSPFLWTREDEEKKIQREKERKIQEEREREEKLNKQKNLFFCDGLADWKSESKAQNFGDYGAFLGRQNGQNYYLMIPFNHQIWENKTDPAIKRAIENFLWDGNQEDFFIIKGIENIPMEKSSPNYWKRLSNRKEPVFHKIVGLNDKISIAEANEKENPVANKPNDNSNLPPKELNDELLLKYFQKENIESIKLDANGKLTIEYNNSTSSTDSLTNFDKKLEGIDKYLQNKNDKMVSLQELEKSSKNSDTVPTTKTQNNNIPWIICGIGGVLIIGVIMISLLRKKQTKKH